MDIVLDAFYRDVSWIFKWGCCLGSWRKSPEPREEVTGEEGHVAALYAEASSWQPVSHVALRNLASWLLNAAIIKNQII